MRSSVVASSSISLDASTATESNSRWGATPRATSSATRRRAACSSASSRSALRACVPEIAVATSPANCASRRSMAAGSDPRAAVAVSAPQIRRSIRIGRRLPRRIRAGRELGTRAGQALEVVDVDRAARPPDAAHHAVDLCGP